jgi:hypothetical protein
VVRNITQERIVRYVKSIANDPQFNIDKNRIYIEGGSMGGGGALRMAYHHPQVFTAVWANIPWINTDAWAFEPQHIPRVFGKRDENLRANALDGPNVYDWMNMLWLAENNPTKSLPPAVLFYRPDDAALSNKEFPALLRKLEENKCPFVAEWRPGGHKGPDEVKGQTPFIENINRYYRRFQSNEAYPAFANASNSDAFGVEQGQRNGYLDWSSALRDLFPDKTADNIEDTKTAFSMTFKSLRGDATAQVTIR